MAIHRQKDAGDTAKSVPQKLHSKTGGLPALFRLFIRDPDAGRKSIGFSRDYSARHGLDRFC
jgi:hypothetical protein